jgi:hypothetical protein
MIRGVKIVRIPVNNKDVKILTAMNSHFQAGKPDTVL